MAWRDLRDRLSAWRRGHDARVSAGEDAGSPDPVQAVIDGIDDPLLILDGVRVAHANAAARALLGAYVTDEDARLALRHPAAAALLAGREAGPIELTGLGGRDRHWLLAAAPIGPDQRLLRLTDRSAGRAAERMRVDFVANASHELRTPLAALIGFIETLEEANAPADAETRLRFLGIMGGEARRMQRLIDDLMSLSRIEADRYMAPRDFIDFAAVVRTGCAEIRAADDSGRVACTIHADPAPVLGDQAQLSQLLHNIVGNAFKYGRDGSPVRVTLTEVDQAFRLDVADEGDGIAHEHLPRLTERFYRVDPGRSRSIGGTGLGLAIVKHIVERHRGRLEIMSEVGLGTTVTIWLPQAARAVS